VDELILSCKGFTANQPADSCQLEEGDQELYVYLEDAGGGVFLVLETERWAIDGDAESIDKFAAMLKKMLKAGAIGEVE
jgi:hypothetical protein